MAFLSIQQANELAHLAHLSDKEIRSDLVGGFIKDENDYTSNLTGTLRRNINTYSKTGLNATSYVLPTHIERTVGCDATIILQIGNIAKILVFEAKFPRISQQNHQWDYVQTSTGLSHFTDQLNRQKPLSNKIAVFEMFYCEYPFSKQPSYFQNEVSSCVWHKDAFAFENKRQNPSSVWSQNELISMLSNGNQSIGHIILEVATCKVGEQFTISGDGNPLSILKDFRINSEILIIKSEEKKTGDFYKSILEYL